MKLLIMQKKQVKILTKYLIILMKKEKHLKLVGMLVVIMSRGWILEMISSDLMENIEVRY